MPKQVWVRSFVPKLNNSAVCAISSAVRARAALRSTPDHAVELHLLLGHDGLCSRVETVTWMSTSFLTPTNPMHQHSAANLHFGPIPIFTKFLPRTPAMPAFACGFVTEEFSVNAARPNPSRRGPKCESEGLIPFCCLSRQLSLKTEASYRCRLAGNCGTAIIKAPWEALKDKLYDTTHQNMCHCGCGAPNPTGTSANHY